MKNDFGVFDSRKMMWKLGGMMDFRDERDGRMGFPLGVILLSE